MQPKVKICGLTTKADIEAVNALKPNYIGFIFAESKRKVTIETAKKLKSLLNNDIFAVGVFVETDIKTIALLLETGVIDVAQLHGAQTEADIIALKKRTNKPIIKAISVLTAQDILDWQDSQADFLLLDNGAGGTGKQFNWSILNEISNFKKNFFLAGGLTADNVSEALSYHPYAVDVSGGVEQNGKKDYKLIDAFLQQVRRHSND